MQSKKLITSISMICLMAVLLIVGVWALTEVQFKVGGDIEYTVPIVVEDPVDYPTLVFAVTDADAKTCSVTQNTSNYPTGDVEIPAYVEIDSETYAVTSVLGGYDSGLGFGYNSNITSVSLPKTMESVASYAFESCSSLTNIYVQDAVTFKTGALFGTSVQYNVYDNAKYLGSKTNPYLVLVLPTSTSITSLTIHEDCRVITGGDSYTAPLANMTSLTSIVISDKVKSIGDYAFYGCTSLTSITIPDSVTSIGGSAFDGCTNLAYNTYDNATYLGNSANPYVVLVSATSTSITSCTINSGCRFICVEAFESCSGLTSVTIPDSVTSIGDSAFRLCTGLTSITIPNGVKSIGGCAFQDCTGLTSITIPNGVKSIGGFAFQYCTGLTSITIPNSVTSIGQAAFNNCTGLTSISVDSGNSVYDSRNNCNALIETATNTLIQGCNNSTIPDGVTSIRRFVFHNCTGLASITIPSSVTSIEEGAFYGCTNLATVNVKATSVPTGGDSMFGNCSSSLVIYVPTAKVSAYKAASGWSEYSTLIQGKSF